MTTFVAAGTSTPAPLLLVLHGYGGDGANLLDWSGLRALKGVHLVAPDGTRDSTGRRFWNATPTCCDFEGAQIDDVKYLSSLVDDVAANHPVDRARVYAFGLSNGGAMAMRLGCEGRVAAVVSFAAPWNDEPCAKSFPLRVLHGTADRIVPYGGGSIVKGIHPKAHGMVLPVLASVSRFALRAGCTGELTERSTLDLSSSFPGDETTASGYDACQRPVELWTLRGAPHVPPPLNAKFVDETWKFLTR